MSTTIDTQAQGDLSPAAPADDMDARMSQLMGMLNTKPQADCPVREYFAPGMYAREMRIPRGTTVVGAIHKTENLAILSQGVLEVVSGEGVQILHAPCTVRVLPGMRNAVHALQDAVWTNFFPTTETDSDKLVELLTHSKASDLLGGSTNRQLCVGARAAIKE